MGGRSRIVQAVGLPLPGGAVARPSATELRSRSRRRSTTPPRGVLRGPPVRGRGARRPRRRARRGGPSRSRLHPPARRGLRRRRGVRHPRGDLLLHLDGHRPRGWGRTSTSRSPSSPGPITASSSSVGIGAGRRRARRDRLGGRATADDAKAARRRSSARAGPRISRTLDTDDLRGCWSATSSTHAGTRWPTAASPAATAPWSARPASAPTVEDTTDLTGTVERTAPLGVVLRPRPLLPARRIGPRLDAVPLPAVADPQALDLVGPVRERRAASVAGAASRGARWASTSPRRLAAIAASDGAVNKDGPATVRGPVGVMDEMSDLIAKTSVVRRAPRRRRRARRRVRAQRRVRARSPSSWSKASRPTPCTSCGGDGCPSRCTRPVRRPLVVETIGPGHVLGWSWLVAAVPLALRRPGHRRRSAPSPSTPPACGPRPTPTRCSATRSCSASRRACSSACRRPASGSSTSTGTALMTDSRH